MSAIIRDFLTALKNSFVSLSHLTNGLYVALGVESHSPPSPLKVFSHYPLASLVAFEKLFAFLAIHIICVFSPASFITPLFFISSILKFKMATLPSWRCSFIHCSGHMLIFPFWIILSVEKLALLLPGQLLPHRFSFWNSYYLAIESSARTYH